MSTESARIVVEQPWSSRWLSRIGRAALLLSLGLTAFELVLPVWVGAAFLAGVLSLALSWVAMWPRHVAPGSAEVRDDHLVIKGPRTLRVVALKKIAAALPITRLDQGERKPAVEIRTKAGTRFTVFVADEATAHSLVDELGFGPRGRALRLDTARASRRLFNPLLAILASGIAFTGTMFALLVSRGGATSSMIGLFFFLAMAVIHSVLKRLFAAPRVTLGSDGIAVQERLGTRRIARDQIGDIEVSRPGGPLVVKSRAGHEVAIDGVLVDHELLEAIAGEAKRRWQVDEIHPRALAFERRAKDVKEWKANLRGALDAGYRDAGATVDDANAVLTSPHSTVEQRLGAAMTLRAAGEPPERVRIAAEGAADPRVRIAFEAIADDADDAKLEKALRVLKS